MKQEKPPPLEALLACIKERDEAQAECERLRLDLEHARGAVSQLLANRDQTRETVKRLRAALAVYADESKWVEGDRSCDWPEWQGRRREPWTIAQEAL